MMPLIMVNQQNFKHSKVLCFNLKKKENSSGATISLKFNLKTHFNTNSTLAVQDFITDCFKKKNT